MIGCTASMTKQYIPPVVTPLPRLPERLQANGFIVEYISYINTLLFPLILFKRLSEKVFKPQTAVSDLAINPGIFNTTFKKILGLESFLVPKVRLPYGLSIIAVGRKP